MVGFLLLWEWAARVPISFNFPTPWATLAALVALVRSGALPAATLTSLQSLLLGFGAAVAVGIPLGLGAAVRARCAAGRAADDPGRHPVRAVARVRRTRRRRAAAVAVRARAADHDVALDVRARPHVRDRGVDAAARRRRAGRARPRGAAPAPLAALMTAPVAIAIEGVSKAFGPVQALVDVDVRVRAGEFLSLIGPSGCGKTTLLKIVAGLTRADRGRVTVGDRVVT